MASEKQGCQGRIKELNKLAVYTHCKSHVLNLSIAHACKHPLVRNMIDGINATFLFFDSSPKRQRYFEHVLSQQETEVTRKKLIGLCKTRWVERHTCFDTFKSMYVSITTCLQYILNPGMDENLQDNWAWDAQTKVTAQGILSTLTSFSFLVTFVLVKAVLEIVKPIAAKLQKHDLDICQAFALVEQRITTVKDMRTNIDVQFESLFTESKKIADELGIDVKVPRLCKRQINRSNVGDGTDPSHYFKANVAIPFLDYLYQE
ncbi:hypothetical protein FSP39_022800 [Pinctada imbricata]|uniref:Uncharacterized protein n=1 Tax=Pinctada imbricata TaxID=66713 RepID=A0AA88Y721_PINIB|nr:hypothetical protein FSP39_022800 [Pinctada imbricata]